MKEIKLYLSDKKALVLDKSAAMRNMVERVLVDLGVEKENIQVHKNFQAARESIKQEKPDIIISDFELHDKFGLDLLPEMEHYIENPLDRIFMVITENASHSAVADAAAEEVDGYLLKPFSNEVLSQYIIKIIAGKLKPSDYIRTILKGKKLLKKGNIEDAKTQFTLAIGESDKPTLALYYLGKIAKEEEDNSKLAQEYFKKGLNNSPLHYKSLVGEFEILVENKEHKAAYERIQYIGKHYPLGPNLIKTALILCITNYRFKDVELYFDQYMNLERKPEDLKAVVSQALLTSGKLLLAENQNNEALSYFLKGSIINGRNPNYINNVVDTLLSKDLIEEADKYIGMFDAEDIESDLYKQLLFKISAQRLPYDKVIEEGRKIIQEGIASPEIYEEVFKLLLANKNTGLLETLVYKAIDQYPEERENFSRYLKS